MIEKIEIKKFRNIKNQSFLCGKNLTIISGQNGLGKSSILGLIGQGYSFYGTKWKQSKNREEKEEIANKKLEYQDIYGGQFETVYSDILNLSKKHDHPDYDVNKKEINENDSLKNEYYYSIFHKNKNEFTDFSVYSKDRGKYSDTVRLVTSEIGTKNHLPTSNLLFPTKYLGLNRVFPIVDLGEESKIKPSSFTTEEKEYFNRYKNYILMLEEDYKEEILENKKIRKTVVSTEKYGHEAISVGQDNISKIISIIISFKRLKKEMGRDYKGGILLIDELEVSLFPAALYKLIAYLYQESKSLKLQIIFTTHSLDLLNFLFSNSQIYKLNTETKVVYLKKRANKIEIHDDYDYKKIITDLTLLNGKESVKEKLTLYFEDEEAKLFFKKLVGRETFSSFEIVPNLTLGCTSYMQLYIHNFPQICNNIILLDGDAKDDMEKLVSNGRMKKSPENFIFIPGEDPEEVFYSFLNKLEDNHGFWTEEYTRQMFITNYREKVEIPNSRDVTLKRRDLLKIWFNEEKSKWGHREISDIYRYWKVENEEIIEKFREEFKNTVIKLIEKLKLDTDIKWY